VKTAPRNRWIALLVVSALTAAPLNATAETKHPAPSAEAVASARAHFARGVKLYEEDDFRAALIEFSRAYELAPNWGVLFNVGQSYYQLRDYAGALRTLERYEAEGGAQIPSDRRAQIDRELDELRGRVAHVTLTANVAGADFSLDDAAIGRSPLAGPILIGAGRHRLSASKAGYLPTVRIVDIAGSDDVAIALELREEEARPPVATADSPSYAGAAVTLGLGVAGIAVGSVFGVAAVGNKSNLNKECNTAKACPAAAQGDIDGLSRNGVISTVGFGVGGAALALGAYLFFHERSKERANAGSPRPGSPIGESGATVTPWLGFGAAGLAGSF
jgi:hypothetical protein